MSAEKISRWELRHVEGGIAIHCRRSLPDGKKSIFWEQEDGTSGLDGLSIDGFFPYASERLNGTHIDAPVVIVVEGEKTADALLARGIAAVGTLGTSYDPVPAALESLHGIDVILWRDYSRGGRAHMENIAAKLQGVARSVRWLAWGERYEDDAVDFFERGGTVEQLESLMADATEAPPPATEPETEEGKRPSIHEETAAAPTPEKPPELDDTALYGLAGEIVNAIDPHTEAHPAAVLIHLLGMFGNAIGRTPFVRVAGGSHHHANINALIVGPTSTGRKGTSAEYPKQIIACATSGWRCKGPGLSTGEGLIAGVADLTHDEVKDGVPERDRRAFWLETEFGRTLRVSKRDANSLFPVIQQLWDGDNAEVGTRKNPLKSTDAHVSIFGHVTPDVLRERLADMNAAEGFGNRFLFCWSEQSKSLPDDDGLDEATMRRFVRKVDDALVAGRTQTEFRKDEQAQLLWRRVYDDLRAEKPGLLGLLTHRAPSQVLRLALAHALFDCAPAIRREHLEAALAFWNYSLGSVKFIFGWKTGNLIADAIAEACRAVYPDGLTDTEVNGLFHGKVYAAQLLIAAEQLATFGLVIRTPGKGLGRGKGRSPSIWKATRP